MSASFLHSSYQPSCHQFSRNKILSQFIADLSMFETQIQKFQILHQMNQTEVAKYEEECSKIETEAGSTVLDIEGLLEKLKESQRIRKNKMEYDEIAKEIGKLPSRAASSKNIAQLKEEIEKLHAERRSLNESKELRRKAMQHLSESLKSVQQMIHDERERTEAERASTALMESSLNMNDEEEEGLVFERMDENEKGDGEMDLN
ncbi:THO complex subunit 7 [Nowakowskiella sp. JEL0407]|nr:THO complex subunit 7 [Nowakowskiella sp. JEL0407]